mgnify:CR=1 FL=1
MKAERPQIRKDPMYQMLRVDDTEAFNAARARGPIHFVDLHTSSAPGPPFLTVGDTLRNRRFSRGFPLPLLLGLEEQVDGSLLEYLNNHGFVTLGVEAGEHEAVGTQLLVERAPLDAFGHVHRGHGVGGEALVGEEVEAHGRDAGLHAAGDIPERVTHNDTKLNNVMIDDSSGEGICVIDLDTLIVAIGEDSGIDAITPARTSRLETNE